MLVLTDHIELIVPGPQLEATRPLAPGDRVLAIYESRDGANVVTWLASELLEEVEAPQPRPPPHSGILAGHLGRRGRPS